MIPFMTCQWKVKCGHKSPAEGISYQFPVWLEKLSLHHPVAAQALFCLLPCHDQRTAAHHHSEKSGRSQWNPGKQPYFQGCQKTFSWALHTASVSLSSVNLKTVIKSLFRLHFSGLHTPSPWDLQQRTVFSNLLIISAGFLWILSRLYTMNPWLGLGEKRGTAQQSLLLCSYIFAVCLSSCVLPCIGHHWAMVCLHWVRLCSLSNGNLFMIRS